MSLNKFKIALPLLAALTQGCDDKIPQIDEGKNPPDAIVNRYVKSEQPEKEENADSNILYCADQVSIEQFRIMLGQFIKCEDTAEKAKNIAVRLFEIIQCNEQNEMSLDISEFASLFDEFSKLEANTSFQCASIVMEIRKKMIKAAKKITCDPVTHKPILIGDINRSFLL